MSQKVPVSNNDKRRFPVRKLTMTAMLGAVATVLMKFPSFKLPFMPYFISMDFSELPALIASFALGPISGVIVCLIKNLFSLLSTNTLGVGELSNFLLGAVFVFTAGMFYKHMGGRRGALIGSLLGAAMMAVFSVFSNYYIVYPFFAKLFQFENGVADLVALYQAINPNVKNLWDALIWFNMPFTFIKGLISVVITFLIYKKISPLLKGRKKDSQ